MGEFLYVNYIPLEDFLKTQNTLSNPETNFVSKQNIILFQLGGGILNVYVFTYFSMQKKMYF